jgi:hypothetical protein
VRYFHEEQRFRQWWIWALLLIVALPILVLAATGEPALLLGALIVIAVSALIALARLVVDVDRDAITVAFHFLWPTRRIPISTVRRAQATKYRALLDYGGYGVRFGLRGWAFNVSGDEGVVVETNDGSSLLIGSQRPEELESAIARAVRDSEVTPS